MKKYLTIFTILLTILFLAACNSEESDEDENAPIDDTTSENNEIEEEEDLTEENSETEDSESTGSDLEAVKERTLERYPDDVRVGEKLEFERNDIAHDHVNQIVNSFEVVNEIEGVEPKNDHFLIVNMTIENLIDDFAYGLDFLKPIAYDDSTSTFRKESGELEEEFVDEGDGITTGNVIFDIDDSDYYRIKVNGGYILLFSDEESTNEE